ncbi:MAG TPA: DUF2182 domain-containing protein [Ramlibacter sp.]|nr:DUF2182 domain-containing protein [Ramlibacter sp.]
MATRWQSPDSAGDAPGLGALVLRQRGPALAILALSVAGWAFLAWLTVDMSHPVAQLTMPDSWRWSLTSMVAIWLMWAVMMAAMMLPSALPMILTFMDLSSQRRAAPSDLHPLGGPAAGRAGGLSGRTGEPARGRSFVAAYLVVWFAFSVAATAAQWVLQVAGWVDPMLVSTSIVLTALLLVVGGLYQFSPLKRVCLSHCRTPMGFLIGEWRPGVKGGFTMGLRHGFLCVGCCWALMALLFVGGVMNLAWIAALSVAVAVEKLAPGGERLAAMLGLTLIAAGVVKLLSFVQ